MDHYLLLWRSYDTLYATDYDAVALRVILPRFGASAQLATTPVCELS